MKHRTFSLAIGALILSTHVLSAQEPIRYREFDMGSDVATIARLTGVAPSEAKLVHQRPAVLKDLEWRPRYFSRGTLPQTDPVDLIVFSFYDDQLFRVNVDYDRHRIEGLTEADLIDAIAATYGVPSKPVRRAARPAALYGEADTPLATWGDTEYSVTLMRVAYPQTFRLIVTLTRLEKLARAATTEAVRLDASEAPQREIAPRKQEADEAMAALKKASIENKAVFRP